jgi:ribulose-phosphate 3-epimerase
VLLGISAVCANDRFDFLARIDNHALRATCPLWHIDVLDGSMFDATCFADPTQLLGEDLPRMELHLMVKNPLLAFEAWVAAFPTQVKRAIFHTEIDRPAGPVLERIHVHEVQAGLALNPETPVDLIHEHVREMDLLLLMGVHPGGSGRPFQGESVLQKIQEAKRRWPDLRVHVDGGVNCDTIGPIISRGADGVCASSALWASKDPVAALAKLQKCAIIMP